MTKSRTLADSGTAFTTVSATELGYVDGVTSAIQTQIDAKAPSSTAVTLTGTQTLTNKTLTTPVISTITTKGDLLGYDTALNRIPIGTNDQVLTADSAQALGLKWATPTGSSLTLSQIATGTLSGATVTLSSLSSYDYLYLRITGITNGSGDARYWVRINNDATAAYYVIGTENNNGSGNVYPIATSAFNQIAMDYYDSSVSSSIANRLGIAFQNCKAAGFTSFQSNASYYATSGWQTYSNSNGIFTTAATVSSLVILNNNGYSFTAGTYTLWGG